MEEKNAKLDRKTIIIHAKNKGKQTIRCCCCGTKIGSVQTVETNDEAIRCIIEGLTNDTSKQNLVILVQLFKKVRPIGICVSCKHRLFENYPGYTDNDIHARFDYVMRCIDEKQPKDVKKKSKLRLKACKQFEKELLDKARND